MDHVAIMNTSWKLIPRILSGEKQIESRWYVHRISPWGKIFTGDVVYFKDAGEPVTARARVQKVLQFEHYSEEELRTIIYQYYYKIQFVSNVEEVFEWAKSKRHCILIFLEHPEKVIPFQIDKKGFGNACAWMCVGNIENVKKKI